MANLNFMLRYYRYYVLLLAITLGGCKKLIEIRPPANSITTGQVFQNKTEATSALMGVYAALSYSSSSLSFGTGAFSIYLGSYADELICSRAGDLPFYRCEVFPINGTIATHFWQVPYKIIYQIAASIEGIEKSDGISVSDKKYLISELKFLRAFCYFQLVSIFGDVPFVTTSDWSISSHQERRSSAEIFDIIMKDLIEVSEVLAKQFTGLNGERTRASSWSCYALAARISLQRKDWSNAKLYSKKIIDAYSTFDLEPDINSVFSVSSRESILQWDNSSRNLRPYNGTVEQSAIDIGTSNVAPFYLSDSLLKIFDTTDLRIKNWTKSYTFRNVKYIIPYKYKLGFTNVVLDGPVSEYYTVFRLAEQILIYSEATAHLGDLLDSIASLNRIRKRANLETLVDTLNADEVFEKILLERRRELFCEWGLRFQDLKRFEIADLVLSQKPGWKSTSVLLPLPATELINNQYLKQNPGY